MLKPYAPLQASSAHIRHGFVNRSSYWYFTGSSSLFCSWSMSLEPVTYHTSCVIAIHFRPSSQTSRHTTFAATWTTITLSGRASNCVLWRSLCALNKFRWLTTDNIRAAWCETQTWCRQTTQTVVAYHVITASPTAWEVLVFVAF